LKRDDIEAAVIATPAETHYELAREALLADLHVFVEKPLALNSEQGEELVSLAAEHHRALMVGHLLQYHPAFRQLKQMAHEGELGKINYIYSNRLNLGKIRREENILWSFAPHDISMILSLAAEYPESVCTLGGNYLHRRIADVTTTHLQFPSGLQAHIFVSWLHPFKEQKLVVVGDHKMAVFDDTLPWEDKLQLYPHEIKWHDNVPVPLKSDPERVSLAPAEPLRLECEHFLKSIAEATPPMTDGGEGLRVLAILNASQRSLDHKSSVIRLDAPGAPIGKPQAGSGAGPNGFVHPSAVIDDGCRIGRGTKIWHFSHVMEGVSIGDACTIGQNVVVGPDVTVGSHCKIQNNVSIYKGVTLEDGVFCGPSMVFTNVYNPRAEIRKMDQLRPTLVRRGATIGANATVICGVTLGRYCFVGAGAVVTRDLPDHALVLGNPARQIGWVCKCGERLNSDLHCSVCNVRYQNARDGQGLEAVVSKPS
jgi:UDP-2-acetamido-3-amino-2,3-dideoxy-glucuronate N-acetyltransferase